MDWEKTSSSIEQIEDFPDVDLETKKLATVQRIAGNNSLLSHLAHRISGWENWGHDDSVHVWAAKDHQTKEAKF